MIKMMLCFGDPFMWITDDVVGCWLFLRHERVYIKVGTYAHVR